MKTTNCALEEAEKEFSTDKGIDKDVPLGKVNKSGICSNNKVDELSLGKDNELDFSENHLGKTEGTNNLASSMGEKNDQETSQAIRDTSQNECPEEDDGIIKIHQTCRKENKSIKRSCGNDKLVVTIDESTLVKFRNNFFEAIEELRILRTLDVENEERIKCLMSEKHELERRKEEEISKYNTLVEQHAQQEIDKKKQLEDRLLQFEEEKAKQTLTAECTEKELKVLKDEVRALHLVKYSLEMKIKEQERVIQLQKSTRNSHESQMSALEQRSKKAFDQCSLLVDLVDKTESNVSAASRLQRKLIYTNEHQKCLLESYKKEMESKKFELVALKANIAQTKDSFMYNTAEECNRLNILEREIRMKNEACQQLQSQIDAFRKENEKLTGSLKEAHTLLDRHVQSINKHSELETIAHLELDEIKTECQALKETLFKEKEEKQGIEETFKTNKAEWETQKRVLESRLADLQKEFDSLSKAKNSLEQLNSNWSEKNMEQKTRIESLLIEVDELRIRLTHAEQSELTQKDMNQKIREALEMEISSLNETLLKSKQDGEIQTKRAESLENKCNGLRKRVEELEHEMKKTEKEQVLQCKEITDTSCQTDDNISEPVSSSSELLLKSMESCKTQMERAGYLQTQCALLNKKVRSLMEKLTEREKAVNIVKESIAVQTDHVFKVDIKQQDPENGNDCSSVEINEGLRMNEAEAKESSNIHYVEEKELTKIGSSLAKEIAKSPTLVRKAIENVCQVEEHRFVEEIHQPAAEQQLQVDRDGELVNTTRNNFSKNTETVSATIVIDPTVKATPSTTPPKDCTLGESGTEDIGTSKNVEIEMINENGTTLQISQEIVEEGVEEVGQNLKVAILLQNNSSAKELNTSNTAAKDNEDKKNQVVEKVRFGLEETTNTRSQGEVKTSPSCSKKEIRKDDFQVTFSDNEEDEKIDQDVSQRISRIQNLLRSDRLRTNRKRKYPVV